MKYTGYIEGYYGKLLSWDERHQIIDHLSENDLNTFFYCPKEDRFHRSHWKEPYPESWMNSFINFINHANKNNIKIIKSFKSCVVCPERWGRKNEISKYKKIMKKFGYKPDAVMTSFECVRYWLK